MRSTNIVSLSENDGWQLAAKKINENFKNLYSSLSNDTDVQVAGVTEIVNIKVQEADDRFNRLITDFKAEIEKIISDVRIESAPAIGTYLYSKTDPSIKWPGTKWQKIDEGLFLVSAGNTYRSGERYGSDAYVAKGYDLSNNVTTQYANKVLVTDDSGQSGFNVPKSIAVPLWERVS